MAENARKLLDLGVPDRTVIVLIWQFEKTGKHDFLTLYADVLKHAMGIL